MDTTPVLPMRQRRKVDEARTTGGAILPSAVHRSVVNFPELPYVSKIEIVIVKAIYR
jgi:hypothetical protein